MIVDPLAYLAHLDTAREILDLLGPLDLIIAWLRAHGYTDQQIGDELGLCRQAVWQRMDRAKARIAAAIPELRSVVDGRSHNGAPHLGADPDLTVDQVADRLHVAPATVRTWIRMGLLQAFRNGKLYRIPTAALAGFERPAPTLRRPRNELGQLLPDN